MKTDDNNRKLKSLKKEISHIKCVINSLERKKNLSKNQKEILRKFKNELDKLIKRKKFLCLSKKQQYSRKMMAMLLRKEFYKRIDRGGLKEDDRKLSGRF